MLATALVWLLSGLHATAQIAENAPPSEQQVREADTTLERMDLVRARREEKLANLEEPRTTFGQKVVNRLASIRTTLRTKAKRPVFFKISPVLGGMPGGAGLSGGLRLDVTRDNRDTRLSLSGRYSIERYAALQSFAGIDRGRFVALGFGHYLHQTKEDFFGVGMQAEHDDRQDYANDEWLAGGLLGLRPAPSVTVGAVASYLRNDIDPGDDESLPNVDPSNYASLGGDPAYMIGGLFAEIDRRRAHPDLAFARRFAPTERKLLGLSPHARSGYYLGVQAHRFQNRFEGPFSFTRLKVEAQEFVPFRNQMHVLAFRQVASLSHPDEDGMVPFYLMDAIGGQNTIRGYSDGRFRDNHLWLATAEYRYEIWHFLDLALFVDGGQVFDAFEDLSLQEAAFGYGAGLRFKTPRWLFTRFDVARGAEGVRAYFSFGSIL